MLTKPLLLLALMAAASATDLDAMMEHIFGTSDSTPVETTPPPVYAKCTKRSGSQGACVPYYMCNEQQLSDYIDIHVPVDACESYLDVCCTDSDRVSAPKQEPEKVIIDRFTEEECSNLYQPHRHLLAGYDHSTQMCYGDKTDIKDTCQGDSGGPLITYSGCMYDVTGVTSYGRACGFPGQAGMYTRVRPYVPWIESIVWPDK